MATVLSNNLLDWLDIDALNVIQREIRLLSFGHVERSSGVIKIVCDTQIEGKRVPRRPETIWRTIIERETALIGNSTRLTLIIGMCGDPV